MRWHPIAFVSLIGSLLCVLSGPSAAAVSSSTTTTTTTTTTIMRPALTPTPANLQAFTAPSACTQNPGMPNCGYALTHGLMLFAWTCTGCDPSWSALFVVNGQASTSGDINLGPSKLLALSVRQNQFKQTDCVAVRVYNTANPGQNATSNAICLSQLLAIHAITMPAPGTLGGSISTQSAQTAHAATNPGLSRGSVILNPTYVPAPTGLDETHDPHVCSDHGGFGGGLACTAGLPTGMLALIWNCSNCKVDGYHLYRVDGGQHALLPGNGAYANDATITLALPDTPSGGFNGKCYAITAYKGSNESALSNWHCAGASSVAQVATLSASHVLHWYRSRDSRTGTIGWTNPPNDSYDSNLYVGYADHYGENTFGDLYFDQWNRLGLAFDLSSLAGHQVSKAMLKLSALSSWHDYDSTDYVKVHTANLSAQSPMACVTIVDLATDHWWLNNDLASTVSYVAPGAFMGPDFSIDVTSAIQKWMGYQSSSNFGFVLRGDDENDQWHGNTNHVCLTQLQSASLVVTYY